MPKKTSGPISGEARNSKVHKVFGVLCSVETFANLGGAVEGPRCILSTFQRWGTGLRAWFLPRGVGGTLNKSFLLWTGYLKGCTLRVRELGWGAGAGSHCAV